MDAREVGEDVGHGGDSEDGGGESGKCFPGVAKHVIHLLSAYPLPKALEEAIKGGA